MCERSDSNGHPRGPKPRALTLSYFHIYNCNLAIFTFLMDILNIVSWFATIIISLVVELLDNSTLPDCERGRTRTYTAQVKSPVLCLLSYTLFLFSFIPLLPLRERRDSNPQLEERQPPALPIELRPRE